MAVVWRIRHEWGRENPGGGRRYLYGVEELFGLRRKRDKRPSQNLLPVAGFSRSCSLWSVSAGVSVDLYD